MQYCIPFFLLFRVQGNHYGNGVGSTKEKSKKKGKKKRGERINGKHEEIIGW